MAADGVLLLSFLFVEAYRLLGKNRCLLGSHINCHWQILPKTL